MKTFPSKFAGQCEKCHERFPKGTTIAYDGKAWHPACLEAEKAAETAYYAKEDAERAAFQAESSRKSKAGEYLRIGVEPDEEWECLALTVTGAHNDEQAREAAWATVYGIRAAGGTAELLKHKGKGGKWYYGRQLGYWASHLSTSWMEGGIGYRLLVNETHAEWRARRAEARLAKAVARARAVATTCVA